jgi:hypothetical protein
MDEGSGVRFLRACRLRAQVRDVREAFVLGHWVAAGAYPAAPGPRTSPLCYSIATTIREHVTLSGESLSSRKPEGAA